MAGTGGSAAAAAPAFARGTAAPSFAGLSPYYQAEFSKIYNSNESYKGCWNWAAFFFGPLWAMSKNLWPIALIVLALSFISGGLLGLVAGGYFGARGNYIYYSNFVNGKQLAF